VIIGPFDDEGKRGFATEYEPEHEFPSEFSLTKSYQGKERPIHWRMVPNDFSFGWLDVGALLRPQKNICAYATTFVRANEKRRSAITAWVGTAGAFKLFLNGKLQLQDDHYRGHDADRFSVELPLTAGFNEVMLKICNGDSAPVVSLRFADELGRPSTAIEVSNDPANARSIHEAVRTAEKQKPKQKVASSSPPAKEPAVGSALIVGGADTRRGKGPLQVFEALTRAKAPRATDLAHFAEYLQATRGDDPAQHQARDLAIQAADAEPTVPHLLLAANLAEDRNQRARWLEKAERVQNVARDDQLQLTLAEAAHERSGPHPQGAIRWYKEALAIDPDSIDATVQLAELYGKFGLDQSALVLIDQALGRTPNAVRLLAAKAERLRKLGRSTEASETERRYANFRFDDAAWLGKMVDLALSRQDSNAAHWWAQRLLDANPHSQWALGLVARAERAAGDTAKATLTYRKALDLAPDDTGTLRAFADLQGELGHRTEQIQLLRRILDLAPQNKDVRDYVENLEPQRAHADETYAWAPERFLPQRFAPLQGQNRRTLRDLTVTTVFPNGLSSRFRQLVFQPMTDAAAAMSRQYAFSYEADRQVVQLRGARVFRGDGRIDEAIESGEAAVNDPSISMYTSQRTFYVQFPRLEPKDVVELRYRIEDMTPRNEYADYFGDLVYLQSDEPVFNAEYMLISPRTRKLKFDTNMAKLLKHETSYSSDNRIDRFAAANLSPIQAEPQMPAYGELAGFIHVSTFESWNDLGRWYWGFIKDQFDVDEETRRLALRIAGNATTEAEKVQAVYDWVVQNTRYVALEFGVYGYKPHRAVQTLARGWGDCKDKATAIIVLLKNLGIDARFVALRTQLRGDFASDVASLAPFDHAIAYVPSLQWYLDGTAEGSGSRELPVMDRGALGLQIWDGQAQLVRITQSNQPRDEVRREITVQLDAGGSAQIELHTSVQGSVAPEWRHRYEAEATRSERMVADLGRDFPGFTLTHGNNAVTTQGLDDIERDVAVTIRGRAPNFARREGELLSMPVTPEARLTPLYASLSERRYDVRLRGVPVRKDTFAVKIPPGFHVLAKPKDTALESKFGRFELRVEAQANKVTVTTALELRTERVTPAEYAAFRSFCAEVDRALEPRLQIGRKP
jgi:transglutaminase-like putative cysteine protease/Tfp pilus assembly protein PilF